MLPRSSAHALHDRLTQLLAGERKSSPDFRARFDCGVANLQRIAEDVGVNPAGRPVLEWGTGWHGIDLIIFHVLGAPVIHTVDHMPHLDEQLLRAAVTHLVSGGVGPAALTLNPQADARLQALAERAANTETLADLLAVMNVQFHHSANCRCEPLGLPQAGIGLFYSHSVLQRIPERLLRSNLQYVGTQLMEDDGVFFHSIDQKDIHAQDYVGTNLWELRYLKYSEWFFHSCYSGELNRQNRLRESDFLEILAAAEMPVIAVESTLHASDLARLEQMRVAKRFRGKELEDLAYRSSYVVGKKSTQPVSLTRTVRHKP